jgi:hypothetical protein
MGMAGPIYVPGEGPVPFIARDFLESGRNRVYFFITDGQGLIYAFQSLFLIAGMDLSIRTDREVYSPDETAVLEAYMPGGIPLPPLTWLEKDTGLLLGEGGRLEYSFPPGFIGRVEVMAVNPHLDIGVEAELTCEINFDDMKLTRIETGQEIYFIDQLLQKQGVYQHYHSPDKLNLKYSLSYYNGQPHGPYYELYEEGNIRTQGQYAMGHPHGTWEEFHASGQVALRYSFEGGLTHGLYETFHENGVPESTGEFFQGMKEGDFMFFRSTGTLERLEVYEKGILVFEETY